MMLELQRMHHFIQSNHVFHWVASKWFYIPFTWRLISVCFYFNTFFFFLFPLGSPSITISEEENRELHNAGKI